MATSARMRWSKPMVIGKTPTLKNHTAVLVNNELFVFGGYDGRRNHAAVHILDCTTFEWRTGSSITGTPPAGRNGHTATLAGRKIFIIGGWLGSGPFAADDCHYLDTDAMHWTELTVVGKAPGPCNMHTADYMERRRQILVFRGGNGREYLNDLHGLNVDTCQWEEVHCEGSAPPPRANHASAVVGTRLFIFGGWNGERRLNDIHFLDSETLTWHTPEVSGPLPYPRAGMTFTSMRGRLLLFGGSGTSAKCFNDLQIFDPSCMAWLETQSSSFMSNGGSGAEAEGGMAAGTMQQKVVGDSYATSGHPNPNDEHSAGRVLVVGEQPSHRAGHTATVVNHHLVVIGGSYGSEYLGDLYLLDTDPVPDPTASSASSHQVLCDALRCKLNSPEFSDVTFLVEGRPIYAHKVILALISDRFRALFTSGFQESSQREIVISDWSYSVFLLMMEYLYTAKEPATSLTNPTLTVELLELADQYMLDHLKEVCEARLQEAVSGDTVLYFRELAERTNATQLAAVCEHFLRNNSGVAVQGMAVDSSSQSQDAADMTAMSPSR